MSPLAQPAQLRRTCRRTPRPSPAPASALKPSPPHQVSLQVLLLALSSPIYPAVAGALSSGLTGRGPLSPAIGCPVLPQVKTLYSVYFPDINQSDLLLHSLSALRGISFLMLRTCYSANFTILINFSSSFQSSR